MVIYVPGTEETDPKKQNMSLQAIGAAATTAIKNIATNTTNIATNTTDIATNTANIATLQALVPLSKITASLGADVAISGSVGTYASGPSIAQGTSGIWFVSGTVTFLESVTPGSTFKIKLWDGATIIASSLFITGALNFTGVVALSGIITSPAGNLRIDVANASTSTGVIKFNSSGNSKDSTITAIRIG